MDENKIFLASSSSQKDASTWWFDVVCAGAAPTIWVDFCDALIGEFVLEDHARHARDKLRRLTRTASVSRHLFKFCKVILAVSDMHQGEKVERFLDGLKPAVKLEVLKSYADSF